MSILKATTLGLLVAVSFAAGASAHDSGGLSRTQARQLDAIEQGRRDGSITRREYRDLVSEQARIADMERRARANGHVSGREVRTIREAQRDAAVHISEDSTNGRTNLWRRWKARHGL
ncbi:MAG: hypothetical protein AB7O57_20915 [Hyphomicrobiaceae bacterium]